MKRKLLTSAAVTWAAWWGLVGASVLTEDGVNGETVGLTVFFLTLAALPAPMLVRRLKVMRADRRQRRRRRAEQIAQARLLRFPQDVRDQWRRLEAARTLAVELADDGWIDRAALTESADLIERLERMLVVDDRTDSVGGAPSATLRRQLCDLTDLLVALCDEAVENQAALTADHPTPATLTQARERLTARRAAYESLGQPRPMTSEG